MNTKIADKIFHMLFIFIFLVGMVGMPNTRAIAQSPLPELTLEKSATPALYSQVGDVINYNYLLTNTGSGTLTGPFTVTDDKTVVTCPQNMKPVDLSNTVLFDHFENGNLAQYVEGAPAYLGGPDNFGQAIDFSSGAWLRYDMPGWYQWGTYYEPAGKAGSVDLWVYPKKYNIELVDINWNYSNSPPSSGGYILHFSIDPDGKLTGKAWSSIYGPETDPTHPVIQLPTGNTTIPLNQWTHVAYTWGANGTRTFVNGIEDAFSPDNLYPALNASNYLYVPYWGFPDLGYIDDLRITNSSQTNFGVSSLAQGESITCNGSYPITQSELDNGSVTNAAQAHGFFGTTPIDSNQDTATVSVSPSASSSSFEVWAARDEVDGWSWLPNSDIQVEIDGPGTGIGIDYTTSASSDASGHFNLYLTSIFDIRPGQQITVTSGQNIRTHVVTPLGITRVDVNADEVSGIASPGTDVDAWFCLGENCSGRLSRYVVADQNGTWIADFSIAGPNPGEEATYDIVPGILADATQYDADGDRSRANWQVLNPGFLVRPDREQVHTFCWGSGTQITLTIDDPGTAKQPDYTDTGVVMSAPGTGCDLAYNFELRGLFDIQAGFAVTVSDGTTTLVHTVTDLAITNVDLVTDTVHGTAKPGSLVSMEAPAYSRDPGVIRYEIADAYGNWVADFSQPGNESGEEATFDIGPGDSGEAYQQGQDGATYVSFDIPNPSFSARLNENQVHGYQWPLGTLVTLTIDDPNTPQPIDYTDALPVLAAEWDPSQTFVQFELGSFELASGQLVSMSQGGITKTHTVTDLIVSTVDPVADTVSGTTDPGTQVDVGYIQCDENGCTGFRRVLADTNGNWTADFAHVGEGSEEQDIIDLRPDMGSEARQCDDDGDCTMYGWRVSNPFIIVRPEDDSVFGNDWPIGATLNLEIEDPATPITPDHTASLVFTGSGDWEDGFELGGIFDIQPGHVVTLSDGNVTKQHTVTHLAVTNIDLDADTVAGTGFPGSEIHVGMVCDNNSCTSRNIYVDETGNWTADFSVPGNKENETIFDIRPGSGSGAYEIDEDADATSVSWQVPNPTISARANEDRIEGMGWTYGSTVTIEINDPATGVNLDYKGTATVGFADWDPNQTWFGFNTNDYDIKEGDLVKGTSGKITKELLVSGYEVTRFDLETEMVYGTANSGQRVNIWTCWQSDPCVDRDETAGQDGKWVTNFSVPGEQDWENKTADLQPGSWIDSSVSDEDGDSTMFGFGVPNPTLHAVPTFPEVHGHDWPAGAEVTLTIDDDTNPANGVLYTHTKNADDDPWCGYPCFDLSGVFDLQTGQYVTMTDGVITKVVQVSTLKIMSVDAVNDRLSGVADAGSDVMINIWSQDGKARHTVADANGNWLVDFSIFGDEDFEQFTTDITDEDNGRAIQLNPDGSDDGTLEYWPMINNPPVANAGPDVEDYAGNTITLDASASSDPEAGTLTYEWDLDNDGQYDDASGVITTTSFNQVGAHVIGLEVTDEGGLSDTDIVTVTVLPWTLKGFYQPVDMNGVYNVTKNGATVPFKFEIFAGTTELTNVALIKSISYVQTACNAFAATDQIEVTSTEVTSLHYDTESGQFIYKWKTPKTVGNCYRVTMITADGSSLLAYFKLK
jgi:hypothetical protein